MQAHFALGYDDGAVQLVSVPHRAATGLTMSEPREQQVSRTFLHAHGFVGRLLGRLTATRDETSAAAACVADVRFCAAAGGRHLLLSVNGDGCLKIVDIYVSSLPTL